MGWSLRYAEEALLMGEGCIRHGCFIGVLFSLKFKLSNKAY